MANERQITVGATFPQTEIGADVGGVRAYAEAAQDLDYKHLLIYDHVLGADPDAEEYKPWKGPYTAHTMFHEVMVLFRSFVMIASSDDSTTAASRWPARAARARSLMSRAIFDAPITRPASS